MEEDLDAERGCVLFMGRPLADFTGKEVERAHALVTRLYRELLGRSIARRNLLDRRNIDAGAG